MNMRRIGAGFWVVVIAALVCLGMSCIAGGYFAFHLELGLLVCADILLAVSLAVAILAVGTGYLLMVAYYINYHALWTLGFCMWLTRRRNDQFYQSYLRVNTNGSAKPTRRF